MHIYWIISLLVMVIELASCSHPSPGLQQIPLPLSANEDFFIWPTPRDFFGAGTVYRVNSDTKTQDYVMSLSVKPKIGNEWLPSLQFSGTRGMDMGAFLTTLGEKKVAASLSSESSWTVTASFGPEGKREFLDDFQVNQALADAERSKRLIYQDGWEYYVIRQAMAVSKLSYEIKSSKKLDSNIKATLHNLLVSKGNLNFKGDSVELMTLGGAKLYYIAYRPSRIIRTKGFSGSFTFLDNDIKKALPLDSNIPPPAETAPE